MTLRGEQMLRTELERLLKLRPQISEAFAEARELGDLKENAEYHAARERQGFIEGRIAELEDKLARAEVIDVKLLDTKTHQLTVQFQLPIVNDSLEYESKGKKSGPYRVHEGSRSLTLDPLLERGSKKKEL